MVGPEKQGKDYARISAVSFVFGIIGLILANKYVADFPLKTKMAVFLVMTGIILYSVLWALKYLKSPKEISFQDTFIFFGVIALLVYAMIKFDIAPEFSIVADSIKQTTFSIVGLG